MYNQGWICLHRKLLKNPISSKPSYLAVWVHLLLLANHEETHFIWNNKKQVLKVGQLLTGRKKIAKKTGVAESQVYKILKYLELEQQIEQQTYTKFTVITIVNWSKYQQKEQQKEQQSNNRVTAEEQQSNTYNNTNNTNNENKNISKDIGGKPQEYGDEFINRVQKFLKDRTKYPHPLSDIHDRRRLHNLKQVLSPRKGKDEFMSEDPIENFKAFIVDYFKSYEEEFRVRSIKRLVDYARGWRENEGELINEVKQEQGRVEFQRGFQQEQGLLKEQQRKLYEDVN